MKFTSIQPKFYQGFAITEKIIGKNLTLPILTNTLINANKEKSSLKLCSTDLEMGVEVEITAKVEESGSIAIPTKLASNFIRDLPHENIEFTEKNKKLSICCVNYKSTIKGESAEDFPIIPNPNTKELVIINGEDFISGIAAVVNSASNMEIKPEITGVLVNVKEDSICFVATDSFRLSEKSIQLNKPNSHCEKIIIPKRCCDGILKVFQGIDSDLTIQLSDSQIIVKNNSLDALTPQIRFIGRLIDGEYPDYEQIMPKNFSKTAEAPKNEFIQRIKTASLFSNKINEITCAFNSKKQQIEIFAANQEYGDYLTVVPCSIQGEDEKITFNFQYLLDGIQYINSPNIYLKMNGPATPVLIEAVENEGFKYLVMPIRTT